jgi:hypothetical protein
VKLAWAAFFCRRRHQLTPEQGLFSKPEIDHFVMAITSAEAIARHTSGRPWPLRGGL